MADIAFNVTIDTAPAEAAILRARELGDDAIAVALGCRDAFFVEPVALGAEGLRLVLRPSALLLDMLDRRGDDA